MTAENHPDLFGEATARATREMAEAASVFAAAARAYLQRKAQVDRMRAERTNLARRQRHAQERAEHAEARSRWAPANDPSWLGDAGLLDTARAWGAALAYADPAGERFDRSAATAMRNCEDRLRDLHSSAMARYDRLRADGLGPAEAMREAALLFARRPAHEQPGGASRRATLEAGNGLGHTWGAAVHRPTRADLDHERQRLRGLRIVEGIQVVARRTGRPPLDEYEQRATLESMTNLPTDLIHEVASASPAVGVTARRPWQHDFPFPIKDVVAMAAAARERAAADAHGARRAPAPMARPPQRRR